MRSVEDRAALVIPAIGVIVGIVGTNVSSQVKHNAGLMALLVGLAVSAVGAVLLAILAMAPRSHSNGPSPDRAVKGISEDLTSARVNYVKSLGFAVYSEGARVNAKALWLNWSLRVLGFGILLLLLFAGLGGLK